MNKKDTEEKIILYLDKQLSPDEEKEFEIELKNSPLLMQRLENVKKRLMFMKEKSLGEADENYFINTIAEFRKRGEKKLSGKMPVLRYAFSVTVGLSVILIAFLIIISSNTDEFSKVLSELSNSELDYAIDEYSDLEDSYPLQIVFETGNADLNSEIDSVITNEIISFEGASEYLAFNDQSAVLSSISDEEAEAVYQHIINTDILNGDL